MTMPLVTMPPGLVDVEFISSQGLSVLSRAFSDPHLRPNVLSRPQVNAEAAKKNFPALH